MAACTTTTGPTTSTSPPTTRPTTTTPPTTQPPECPTEFCVKYHIHPDAAWADGVPVTADDFVFTLETVMNEQLEVASREGYQSIVGYEIRDPKTVTFIFDQPYGPWQTLFDAVLPSHELTDQPINTVWDRRITLGSGPFTFGEWVDEQRIVLRRNQSYWSATDRATGAARGDVDEIHFVFLGDGPALVEALGEGAVDVINAAPDAALLDAMAALGGVSRHLASSATWEHIDFNLDDARLRMPFVRMAIARAIDREAILDAVVRPIHPEAIALGNTIWPTNSPYYQDHFGNVFPYSPEEAEQLLIDNGCVRGSDAIYECAGERLSFTWSANVGHEGGEEQFDLVSGDLATIGIELLPKFGPTTQVFSNENFYGGSDSWQLLNFAWRGFADPAEGATLYHCVGEAVNGFGVLNNLRYCDEDVEALIRAADRIVDPDERAAAYNAAVAQWLAGAPLVPLYLKPAMIAWVDQISGIVKNPAAGGTDLWNVAAWSGQDIVVFGTDQQPASLQPVESDGRTVQSSQIWSAIIEGAFLRTPDSSFVPILVESAELLVPPR